MKQLIFVLSLTILTSACGHNQTPIGQAPVLGQGPAAQLPSTTASGFTFVDPSTGRQISAHVDEQDRTRVIIDTAPPSWAMTLNSSTLLINLGFIHIKGEPLTTSCSRMLAEVHQDLENGFNEGLNSLKGTAAMAAGVFKLASDNWSQGIQQTAIEAAHHNGFLSVIAVASLVENLSQIQATAGPLVSMQNQFDESTADHRIMALTSSLQSLSIGDVCDLLNGDAKISVQWPSGERISATIQDGISVHLQ